MKQFRIRCSAIGKIMSGSIGLTETQKAKLSELETRKKGFDSGDKSYKALTANMEKELSDLLYKQQNPELPAGAKTYCETWLKQEIYGRRKEFTSKYTDKGDSVEWKALESIGNHLGLEVTKNDEWMEDGEMHGTPDSVLKEFGIDAKTPWDCFTFPLFEDKLPEDDYYWQAQGYMALSGKPLWKIIFALVDTPEHLIRNEARSWCYKMGAELSPEIMDEFRDRMTYQNISEEFKIKVFDVPRNDSDIKLIRVRVKMCREYISKIIDRNKPTVGGG